MGVGNLLAKHLESRLGIETRVTVPGHVQRGGTPTAFDRFLATRFGIAAVEQIVAGNFGCMVALQGSRVDTVPLKKITSRIKTVDPCFYYHLTNVQERVTEESTPSLLLFRYATDRAVQSETPVQSA